MSLTNKLLQLDIKKYNEEKTGEIEVKRLSEIIGEPFMVKVKEIDDYRMNELQAMLLDKKGNVNFAEIRKVHTLIACAGVTEPNLGDEKLQKHFGAATPKDLADKLFKGKDLAKVADLITSLSNFDYDDEEVKN